MHSSSVLAARRSFVLAVLFVLLWSAPFVACRQQSATPVSAAELKPIQLPKPQINAGMPLMQALAQRRTTRSFQDKPLPPQASLQSLMGGLWRQPLAQPEAGIRTHRALGDEQAGG